MKVDNTEQPRLSICIATRNRADFISETLDSIVGQIETGVEIVIVDGASSDETPKVLGRYAAEYPQIVYRREPTNSGVDRDYDKAVSYATGRMCWLMTDDDLLRPGAIRKVLDCAERDVDLVVTTAEVRTADFARSLGVRLPDLKEDRDYLPGQGGSLFRDVANHLSFIGCVIVSRTVWLQRDRARYFGSLFVHVGVIFQHPALERARVIAEPLVTIRYGNAMWLPRWFEIWSFKWPDLIWSFGDFSDATKADVVAREPWRRLKTLLLGRAMGNYSINEFHRFLAPKMSGLASLAAAAVALIPGPVANLAASVYLGVWRRNSRVELYDLALSPNATFASRWVMKLLQVDLSAR